MAASIAACGYQLRHRNLPFDLRAPRHRPRLARVDHQPDKRAGNPDVVGPRPDLVVDDGVLHPANLPVPPRRIFREEDLIQAIRLLFVRIGVGGLLASVSGHQDHNLIAFLRDLREPEEFALNIGARRTQSGIANAALQHANVRCRNRQRRTFEHMSKEVDVVSRSLQAAPFQADILEIRDADQKRASLRRARGWFGNCRCVRPHRRFRSLGYEARRQNESEHQDGNQPNSKTHTWPDKHAIIAAARL